MRESQTWCQAILKGQFSETATGRESTKPWSQAEALVPTAFGAGAAPTNTDTGVPEASAWSTSARCVPTKASGLLLLLLLLSGAL